MAEKAILVIAMVGDWYHSSEHFSLRVWPWKTLIPSATILSTWQCLCREPHTCDHHLQEEENPSWFILHLVQWLVILEQTSAGNVGYIPCSRLGNNFSFYTENPKKASVILHFTKYCDWPGVPPGPSSLASPLPQGV